MLAIGQPGEQFIVTDRPAADFVVTDRNPWLPPAPAAADPRPIVVAYSATYCQLCPTVKAELEAAAKNLPFRIEWQDITNGGAPPWLDSVPAFAWSMNEKSWYAKGYQGTPDLVARYNNTRAPPKSHKSHPSHPSQKSHS